MLKLIFGMATHGIALAIGLALGIYLLPILIAPPPPSDASLRAASQDALYTVEIPEELPGTDFLHWGKGTFSVSETQIVHQGRLAPGPDYRLYLVDRFVDEEAAFLAIKDRAAQVGRVHGFDGFVLPVPDGLSVSDYNTIVIWCENFGEFITAAQFR